MLDIFGGRHRPCDGLARRAFLRIGSLGLGGLTLPALLRARAGASAGGVSPPGMAVIQVVLSGGPSHLETWDPKPGAPSAYRTGLRATATAVPGLSLGELMPRQARAMDRMAVVRSLAHDTSDHLAGLHRILTGYAPTTEQRERPERPSVGSVAARLRGSNSAGVPAYAAISGVGTPGGMFRGGAYLGPGFDPFRIESGPGGEPLVRDLAPPPGLTLDRLGDRRALLLRLDRIDRARDASGLMDGLDRFEAQAYDMVTGPSARRALDLSGEDSRLRDRYGRTRIGQSCLLARRLVEAGVGFVTISEGDWDHHAAVEQSCRRQVPPMDAAIATLVEDLHDRGLAGNVLVLAWGEFGRTPRLNGSGGRDHWPGSMSAVLAGGGLRMGQAIGSTDRKGEHPSDRPLHPEDVVRTIYHVLGVDPSRVFPDEAGRPMAAMDRGRPIAGLI